MDAWGVLIANIYYSKKEFVGYDAIAGHLGNSF